jgi:hypothetical protein
MLKTVRELEKTLNQFDDRINFEANVVMQTIDSTPATFSALEVAVRVDCAS